MIYKDIKFLYKGRYNIEDVPRGKVFVQKGVTVEGSKLRLLRSIFSGKLESELNRTTLEGAEGADMDDLLVKFYGKEFELVK